MSQQFSTSSPRNAKSFSIAFSSTASASKNPSSPLSTPRQASSRISEHQSRQPHAFDSSRPSYGLNDNDSEEEDERLPVHEEVTGFDYAAGGAIGAHQRQEAEKRPLIIKVESKNNWMDRGRRKGKSLLPKEIQIQRARRDAVGDPGQVEIEGLNKHFGLSCAKASAEKIEEGPLEAVTLISNDNPMAEDVLGKPLTPDELALQALIRDGKGDGGGTRRSDLIIPARKGAHGDHNGVYDDYDEMTSFRADVASRPDSASLADYASVPVEEFGAALLRGMGWKEGEPIGRRKYGNTDTNSTSRRARVPDRRPGYLGIGAKDISGKGGNAETELGAWGKSAMRKSKKAGEGLYTPVLMKNKKTGEMITEEELKALTKQADKREEDWRERRDRNLQKNGRDRKRDYDDDSDEYRRTGESSRAHKSQSSSGRSRDSQKRRYYEDYGDLGGAGETAERHLHDEERWKGQDRDRDSERDKDRDRDRGRKQREGGRSRDGELYSSRPSSSASSRRDRDTDRETYRERDRLKDRRDRDGVDRGRGT